MKRFIKLFVPAILVILLASCYAAGNPGVRVTDAKVAEGIDEQYMPVNARDAFPEGTQKVFCWFSWKDSLKEAPLMVEWTYLTEDIPIFKYKFLVPRKEGQGGIALSMAQGKVLPPGLYRVDIKSGNRILKQLTFKVGEKN